jgi:hypothetical protein
MTSARNRRRRSSRSSPSAPRVIGANDNIETANDNRIRVGIDDRDRKALGVAKARAAAQAMEDAKAEARRLIATGVDKEDVRIVGPMVSAKRVGGLEWLLRKNRITLNQHRAGEHYGDDFARSEEPRYRSCLNDRIGGEPQAMQESKRAATARLAQARSRALQDHDGLVGLMDDVCGRGIRVRDIAKGDDGEAARIEGQLKLGLDFLADHYGIT